MNDAHFTRGTGQVAVQAGHQARSEGPLYYTAEQGGMDRKPPTAPHAGRYDFCLIFKRVLKAFFFLAIIFKIKIGLKKSTCFFLF